MSHESKIGLNNEQIEQAREIFNIFDKNGDGNIIANEIGQVLQQLGQNPTPADIDELLNESDLDRNGQIDFDEFLKVTAHKFIDLTPVEDKETKNRKAFDSFDSDKDGFITKEELTKALRVIDPSHTEEDIEKILKNADFDNDSKISFKEFSNLQF